MARDRTSQIFSLSGPSFLTAVDWSNFHHKRSVAACLVQAVYALEDDRKCPDALAPPWWLTFNFRLVQILDDSHDISRFGAVFEFINYSYYCHQVPATQRPPQYVIAFRGTSLKSENRKEDFKLDVHLMINNHKNSSRFQTGLETAKQMVRYGNVWLAGHSAGSSLALAIGREMVKCYGVHLETYLFNPPFLSLHIEWIKSDKAKCLLRFPGSLATAGVAVVASAGARERDPFVRLSTWVPYLFINRSDPLCSEYAGYFKHRGDMEAIGAGKIGRVATKNSIVSILSSREALHLIPSAYLSINGTAPSVRETHGISQWWRHDLELEYKYYLYN
ncbi:GDSL esterase/lipase-like protein [Salvia divinorum]|uniref:GDSL esterase/lipase-like protein n=1 Tax=Salvia divinorum TaxID=28513 RepID=A0ABD1GFB5_SALDI